MLVRLVRRKVWKLYAACTDSGSCPLLEFLLENVQHTPAGYAGKDRLSKQKARMLTRLDAIADAGPPMNVELCHHVASKIWQLTVGDLRLLWFYDEGRCIIASHGFVKRSNKTPESEKRLAQNCMSRYFEAKKNNTLILMEGD